MLNSILPAALRTASPALVVPPKEEEQNTSLVFSPLDRLVTAWGKAETQATESTIRRGVLLHRYLVRTLAGLAGARRRTARADALDAAHDRLTAEGYDSNCSRFLKIYAAASLLGVQAASSVSAATLREFAPLVKRLADDEDYQFSHDAEARALWVQVQAQRIGPTSIRQAVAAILGREPRTHLREPAPTAADTLVLSTHATRIELQKFLGALSSDTREHLIELLLDEKE